MQVLTIALVPDKVSQGLERHSFIFMVVFRWMIAKAWIVAESLQAWFG